MSSKQNTVPIVAAFDFDGTLTYCDSLFPFLLYAQGLAVVVSKIGKHIPSLIKCLLKKISRQQVKEEILTTFFGGRPIEEIRKLGKDFAYGKLNRLVKPEGLERLQWHLNQGHRCILISASLDIYLHPWANYTGFQDVISSRLESDNKGLATGKLIGKNCRGSEKVRRLLELVGPRENFCLYAYGDSEGDKELLEIADFPYYRRMH